MRHAIFIFAFILLQSSVSSAQDQCPNKDECLDWMKKAHIFNPNGALFAPTLITQYSAPDKQLVEISEMDAQATKCKCFLEAFKGQQIIEYISNKKAEIEKNVQALNEAAAKKDAKETTRNEKRAKKMAEKAQRQADARADSERIAKLSQTPSCKKTYSFKNYCISRGELETVQANLNYEKKLSARSGVPNKQKVRDLTSKIVWVEGQIAKEKKFYNQFKGDAPPLSACTLKSEDSGYHEPDEKSKKLYDDAMTKNCGSDELVLDF